MEEALTEDANQRALYAQRTMLQTGWLCLLHNYPRVLNDVLNDWPPEIRQIDARDYIREILREYAFILLNKCT
jgi:hypothetical protein